MLGKSGREKMVVLGRGRSWNFFFGEVLEDE